MSRNVRRKAPVTASSAKKRRGSDSSSSLDLSGDDGYSGVDEISDDEDDEEDDVDAAEEKNITTRTTPSSPFVPARPPHDDEDEEDEEEEEEEDDDDEDDDGYHFNYDNDDHDNDNASPLNEDADAESASWAGIMSSKEDSQSDQYDEQFFDADYGSSSKVGRHVRFDLPDGPASDDDNTSTDDDFAGMYTDIFVEQQLLDPAFRRELENDPDESSESESYWDFREQDFSSTMAPYETLNANTRPEHGADAQASFNSLMGFEIEPEPSDLDGYETDGETTEEDEPDPPVRRKTKRPSPPPSEGDGSDSELDTSTRNERGQPRVGRFRLDKCYKKPTVVLNPVTRKLMILTPQDRRQLDLSPESFHGVPLFPLEDAPTMLSSSADMMFSALSMSMFTNDAYSDFVNGQAVAEPEAFFTAGMQALEDSEASMASQLNSNSDEDDGERNLDMNDFIAFEDTDSSDSDQDKDTDNGVPSSTPARPTTASSDVDILSHLNSHTVGAFRRNQVNQQLILSSQATQDSLAFSGPYNHTAIRGLRSDRFETAGVPLTPARRRRSTLVDTSHSPLEAVSAKRKASSEAQNGGHKKQRSISDVNHLRI